MEGWQDWRYVRFTIPRACLTLITSVPIVDAAMRQALAMGWMHNRARMIAAMFLVKDLMIDWRIGERVSRAASLRMTCLTRATALYAAVH